MKSMVIMLMLLCAAAAFAQQGEGSDRGSSPVHRPMLINEMYYFRTTGELEKQYPTAAGISVGYGIFYRDIMLKTQIGYSGFSVNPDSAGVSGSLSEFHFLAGPRYFIAKGDFMPYISATVGVTIVTETGPHMIDVNGRILFATEYGVGTMFNVVDDMGLDLAAKYNSHFFYDPRMMTGFEYCFGLTWTL